MASRHEEKEARKQARLEAEQQEARTHARQRRVQLVAGGLAAAVIIVGAIVLVLSGGGDGGGGDGPQQASKDIPKLPAQKVESEKAAAAAAKCTLTSSPIEGRQHEERDFTEADYKTNPPTSGRHFPQWADDGIYAAASTPPLGQLVHTLEHGRIDVQYKPGTPAKTVKLLEAFVADNDGYHMVMFQNPTKMPSQIAATAWGKSLTCDTVDDATIDALRTFRDAHLDKGPELIP